MITVGYDGSSRTGRAVEWAALEATMRNATVQLVTCFGGPPKLGWPDEAPPELAGPRRNVADVVDQALARCRDRHPTIRFDANVVYGLPEERLAAEAKGSDLLVVGTTGHGFLDAWRLGAVSHNVARHAPCPVVLVPASAASAIHNRVVVAVDGSDTSNLALTWAADEADRRQTELVVVHVWSYPYPVGEHGLARDLIQVDASLIVQDAARRARDRTGRTVTELMLEGSTWSELVAQTARADLLVIGSRGQNAVRSLLFGSVAHHVSAHASCPVAVVHAQNNTTP